MVPILFHDIIDNINLICYPETFISSDYFNGASLGDSKFSSHYFKINIDFSLRLNFSIINSNLSSTSAIQSIKALHVLFGTIAKIQCV